MTAKTPTTSKRTAPTAKQARRRKGRKPNPPRKTTTIDWMCTSTVSNGSLGATFTLKGNTPDLSALMKTIPPSLDWPAAARRKWLQKLSEALDQTFPGTDEMSRSVRKAWIAMIELAINTSHGPSGGPSDGEEALQNAPPPLRLVARDGRLVEAA